MDFFKKLANLFRGNDEYLKEAETVPKAEDTSPGKSPKQDIPEQSTEKNVPEFPAEPGEKTSEPALPVMDIPPTVEDASTSEPSEVTVEEEKIKPDNENAESSTVVADESANMNINHKEFVIDMKEKEKNPALEEKEKKLEEDKKNKKQKPEEKSKKLNEEEKGKKSKKDKKAKAPDNESDFRKCFYNRELSWLKFNERVLNEAGNPKVPLAERLSFVSIYQSNLDEFFMIRVGTLMTQMKTDPDLKDNKTGMTAAQQVKAILSSVAELDEKKTQVYEQLMGELEPKGVRLINFNKLSSEESKFLEVYFHKHIAPFLTPMIISEQQPFPFMVNKQLYALVSLRTSKGKERIGVVPCTNSVFKRLIEIPTRPGNFMLSEELILHFIGDIFPEYSIVERTLIRITRNADINPLDIVDEEMSFRDVMEVLVKKRKRMAPVRIELSEKIDSKVREKIAESLKCDKKNVFIIRTPLDMSFVSAFRNYLRPQADLFYPPRLPQQASMLNPKEAILPQIISKDRMLSYPFENIRQFIQMLREAANDENVVSIKITLYRVASHSQIVDCLLQAAENGKEVVVLLELRARFDEENNIDFSKRLEDAGCHILYGLEKYKVHSKLCLISRKVKDGDSSDIQYITHVGTGNYNEVTANLYTDLTVVTANQEIGAEAAEIFNSLMFGETPKETSHLLVAPVCLQSKVLEMMDEQIENAKAGKPAYIGFKINSLTDKVIIDKLIECSRAGVKVDMVIRGICCLAVGIPGYTDNIHVVSIVGRFLEHSRIYIFGLGEEQKVYISSADLMTRNTTRRVEIALPIYDEDIKKRVLHIFDTDLQDDEKGKELSSDGLYKDRSIHPEPLNSQEVLYQEAYDNAPK